MDHIGHIYAHLINYGEKKYHHQKTHTHTHKQTMKSNRNKITQVYELLQ